MMKMAKWCGIRRGIDPELLLKTAEQMQAEQQAAAAQNQALLAQQTEANVAEAAGKQAFSAPKQ